MRARATPATAPGWWRPPPQTPPASRRRRVATAVGFVALSAFTAFAVWSALTVDEYIAEALRASPAEAPNAPQFPPAIRATAVSSVLMWGVVVLHLRRIVRWPWGTVLACVATLHTLAALVVLVSVASLGT
jgi:cytochrome bd-type quinol oxidase subunit 2